MFRPNLRGVVAAAALLLTATASGQAQTTPAGYPADYAQVVKDGTAEGKVVIYTSTDGDQAKAMLEAFKAAYPGIEIDLGKVLHFSGRYWTDYGCDQHGPMSWRFKGPAGSGALADVGSHLAYVSEFLCGDMTSVSGGQLSTVINERPLPLGAVMGHDHAEVSDVFEAVTNDDYAAFSATFENGAGAIEVSRVAAGHANSLIFEVFCENGAAMFDQRRPSEIQLFLREGKSSQAGYRQIILGPEHPYLSGGLAMDAPSVGFGQNDAFAYQARAFLEEVAGLSDEVSLPRCASFSEGVHNMEVLAAVAESAADHGASVTVPTQRSTQLQEI